VKIQEQWKRLTSCITRLHWLGHNSTRFDVPSSSFLIAPHKHCHRKVRSKWTPRRVLSTLVAYCPARLTAACPRRPSRRARWRVPPIEAPSSPGRTEACWLFDYFCYDFAVLQFVRWNLPRFHDNQHSSLHDYQTNVQSVLRTFEISGAVGAPSAAPRSRRWCRRATCSRPVWRGCPSARPARPTWRPPWGSSSKPGSLHEKNRENSLKKMSHFSREQLHFSFSDNERSALSSWGWSVAKGRKP